MMCSLFIKEDYSGILGLALNSLQILSHNLSFTGYLTNMRPCVYSGFRVEGYLALLAHLFILSGNYTYHCSAVFNQEGFFQRTDFDAFRVSVHKYTGVAQLCIKLNLYSAVWC